MDKEAKKHCMGILKGIDQFEKESESEYKDWASDIPREIFKKSLMNGKNIARIKKI